MSAISDLQAALTQLQTAVDSIVAENSSLSAANLDLQNQISVLQAAQALKDQKVQTLVTALQEAISTFLAP